MFNLTEYKRRVNRLTDLLPWAALVAPGVVLNKDGSFQRTMRFRGPDLASSTESQLVAETARLNNALKRMGSGWALFIEAARQHAQDYPQEGAFPEPVSWLVDAERRDVFEREGEHFESHYFITFQYLPAKESARKISTLFIKHAENENRSDYSKSLALFTSNTDRIFDILSDFMYETKWLNDSETLTYLHCCISEKKHKVAVPDVPMYLDSVLADTHLVGGLKPQLGETHLRTFSILGFPSVSAPAILDQLNHLPLEYRWMTRYLPLDKLEAEKILKSYRRQWFSKRKGILSLMMESFSKSESAMVDSAAIRKSQDADVAMQELGDDHVSFGYYTATITVWDKNSSIADDKAREVERIINGLGFTTILETVNAVDAWLSSLPGHAYANVRMPLLHSLNLAHLIPFSAAWAGPKWNDHLKAPPLIYAQTNGNTPFRLSNHIGDVGHQMIIGPTGAGKSVLMVMMALQFLRYRDAQVFIFDKGNSFMLPTLAVGGRHYEVGESNAAGLVFQPLAHIDQQHERTWATDWICELLQNENVAITPDIKKVVWHALTNLATVPQNQRTLTGLKALIQNQKIRDALEMYTLSGAYGQILDADLEVFAEQNWQCFEMEQLMQMSAIITPVLSYIFHVLEKRFDGRPTLMILDEAWLFLGHSIFATKIREWLKTLRKLNVSVIFATQSIDDVLNANITSALIESCPSYIFLPNDHALEPNVKEAYVDLGLNERQIQIIATALPKRQYYYKSTQGNTLFELNLGPLALAICAHNKPEQRKQVRALWQAHPNSADFAKKYLQKQGLQWALDILAERVKPGGANNG